MVYDGKRHTRKSTTRKGLDQKVKELRKALETGIDPNTETFEQMSAKKFEFRYGLRLKTGVIKSPSGISLRTFEQCERSLRYVNAVLGHKRVDRIGLVDAKALIEKHRTTGRTCELVFNFFLLMLPKTIRDEISDQMLEHGVKIAYKSKSRTRVFSRVEAKAIVDASGSDWYRNLFVTLLGGGFRIGEASALLWTDVDLLTGSVNVTKQGHWVKDPTRKRHPVWCGSQPTKNLKSRRVFLTDDGIAAMRDQRLQVPSNIPYVFVSEDLTPVRADSVSKRFRSWLSTNSIETGMLHDLRRTFATLLSDVEPNVANTAEMIGDTVLTAQRHYIKPTNLEQSARRVKL